MIRMLAVLFWLPLVASAQEVFQLPSAKIHCALIQGELFCEVLAFTYARAADGGHGALIVLLKPGD